VRRDLFERGETAVIGIGRSGRAVARLAAREGGRVYVSDSENDEGRRQTAEELRALGIDVELGRHDMVRIARAGLVIVSPGLPPDAAPVVRAREVGVPVVSEVEVALAFLPESRCVAVTGTNGKSTVTALVAHLLRSAGADAVAAGNIGTALSEVALLPHPPPWVSLEISSFQLHDTPSIRPVVGVLTNLAPDHLDRYSSVEEYYADKDRLFANAARESAWVTNADDVEVQRRTARVRGAHRRFSINGLDVEASYDRGTRVLRLLGERFLTRDEVPLFGDHNVANVLAAALAVTAADANFAAPDVRGRLAAGVRSFTALDNRLEVVLESGGVLWINDSKATNVSAARVAIEGMTRPTVVLLGGRHKGEPYTTLVPALVQHAKLVIAFGEAGPEIARDLRGHVALERLGSSFEEVIELARARAAPGDAILLSPACSSFDMFRNYEERGETFRRLARAAR
jgi:UDP-N-acetylmuramoylalanine--D-glutamate ligase